MGDEESSYGLRLAIVAVCHVLCVLQPWKHPTVCLELHTIAIASLSRHDISFHSFLCMPLQHGKGAVQELDGNRT